MKTAISSEKNINFRLLFISSVIAVFIPLFAITFVLPKFSMELINICEERAFNAGRHLMMKAFVEDKVFTEEMIKSSEKTLKAIEETKDVFVLEKIKVLNSDGKVIFSSDDRDVGKIKKEDYFINNVAKGENFLKLVKKDTRTFEDKSIKKEIVEAYIPAMINGSFAGAFELHMDITKNYKRQKQLFVNAFIIIFSAGLFLLIVVSFVVWKFLKAERDFLKFKRVSDDAFYGVAITDIDGYVLYVNKKWSEIHGREAGFYKGQHVSVFYSDNSFKQKEELNKKLLEEGGYTAQEIEHVRSDGTVFPALMSASIIKDKTGSPISVTITMHDISSLKSIEKAFKKSEENLRITLNSIGDGVITTDVEGNVTNMNPVAEEITGWKMPQALGVPLKEVMNKRETSENIVEKAIKEKRPFQSTKDTVITSKNGQEYYIYENVSPILDKNEDMVGIVIVFRNTTKRKLLEEKFMEAQKMKALGILSGGVSHDFNNILMGIMGHCSIALKKLPENNPAFNNLQQILTASKRASSVVQQLLMFSRTKDNRLENVKLDKAFSEVTDLIRAAISSRIAIEWDIEKCSHEIMADTSRLHQILLNLCTNSAYAITDAGIKNGCIKIIAEDVRFDGKKLVSGQFPKGKYVKISVVDNGKGMDEKTMKDIFTPFFTTKDIGRGTGLGLSAVHGIITSHNGFIEVESQVDKGTSINMFFKAAEVV